jgi:putative endonuclease
MAGWAYMLRCADDSYYVGSTSHEDVEVRVWKHNVGVFESYTSKRRPVTLVWSDWFADLRDAHAFERQVKGWSRAKKEALIARDYAKLQLLAKRPSKRPACFEAPLRGAPQHDDNGDRHPEVRVSQAKLATRASKDGS